MVLLGNREYFKGIPEIKYEGKESDHPFAYKYYNPDRVVAGKTMRAHFKFAMAYWHTLCNTGADPFGSGTKIYPWSTHNDPIQAAYDKADAAFEFITKMGFDYYCFHDFDLVDEGETLAVSEKRIQKMVSYLRQKQKESGVKVLWGTSNCFSHPRFMNGAATNPDFNVVARTGAQIKIALDATIALDGENYVYNGPFEEFFIDVSRIPVPNAANFESVKNQFTKLLETENVAAFIFEPLVQGASAMFMYDAKLLDELIAIAYSFGVVTIADEVMTGFGKTGKYFASDYLQNKPDIMCLSKSLTGGVAPMALTTCTQKIYDAFYDDQLGKGFFHGHTYSANPLTCTAALASIKLLQTKEIQENIQRVINAHQQFNIRIKGHSKVKSTRQLGIIFALDLDVKTERYGNLRDKIFNHFMKDGVFLRPLGNTIYILAPFVITDAQLEKIYISIEGLLATF